MTISSPAFENQGPIPQKYTCEGEGINPTLEIKDVTKEAKSLVIIVDDPDAPVGLFTHWILWNMSPHTTIIDEDSVPEEAVEGKNSAGEIGWVAPCPPEGSGIHHYNFQLFALSGEISLEEGTTRDRLEDRIKNMVIDKTELVGTYESAKNHPENITELT